MIKTLGEGRFVARQREINSAIELFDVALRLLNYPRAPEGLPYVCPVERCEATTKPGGLFQFDRMRSDA